MTLRVTGEQTNDRGKCANADILRDVVSWIKFQSAAVKFHYVKAHSVNGYNDGADTAAKARTQLLLPSEFASIANGYSERLVKVSCDIPENTLLSGPSVDAKSTGGIFLCTIMQHIEEGSTETWQTRNLDLRPCLLADLAMCFEKRMNVPQPPPANFNIERMHVVVERAANIPLPSEESPHPTLHGKITEEDIVWAKDHLRTHYNTTVGLDKFITAR
ncbi:hypothetical protein C8R44DRAFT_755287 [Mycena epipterygia]|nr:hypothetical protein C8R44DRAFT_755287 [Mycena epipterygia]